MDVDDDIPTCRICFGTEEPFIRPCSCSGTMQYVHEDCLNEWRTRGASTTAFTSCPQCRVEYSIVNSRASMWMKRPLVRWVLSGVLLTTLLCISSVITAPFRFFRMAIAFVELDMPSTYADTLVEWWANGALAVACIGVSIAFEEARRANRHDSWTWTASVLSSLALHDVRVLRVFAVFGVWTAFWNVMRRVTDVSNRLVTRWSRVVDLGS